MGRTGIIGAMEEEVALLKEKMEIEVVVKKASMEFYQGHLNGREVVVVRSGIGKVNAGMCAQILVDVFNVSHLINTGIAGSLKAEINIGDIVVSSDALRYGRAAVRLRQRRDPPHGYGQLSGRPGACRTGEGSL